MPLPWRVLVLDGRCKIVESASSSPSSTPLEWKTTPSCSVTSPERTGRCRLPLSPCEARSCPPRVVLVDFHTGLTVVGGHGVIPKCTTGRVVVTPINTGTVRSAGWSHKTQLNVSASVILFVGTCCKAFGVQRESPTCDPAMEEPERPLEVANSPNWATGTGSLNEAAFLLRRFDFLQTTAV